MAKQKAKIKSITIELENYLPIDLTMEEARELHEQLDSLFPKPVRDVQYVPYYPWWQRPYYTWSSTSGPTSVSNTSSTTISNTDDLVGKTLTSNNTGMRVRYHS